MCPPGPVAQGLEIVVVQLDVEWIGQIHGTALRHVTVEEREDLVHDLPARERWLFVLVVGLFQYIDLPFELC